MYEPIEFTVKGVVPIMFHNGRLADPLFEGAKRIGSITKKRKKTDDDHLEIARLEWHYGMYVDDDDHPIVPGEGIESALVNAAKKFKLGKDAKSGLLCDGNWPLVYDGPATRAELWKVGGLKLKKGPDGENSMEVGKFADRRNVRVGMAKVVRCRPIFHDWKLTFTVHYLSTVFDRKGVIDIVEKLGAVEGLFEFRPRFGRFIIESSK